MKRLALVALIVASGAAAYWQYRKTSLGGPAPAVAGQRQRGPDWLDRLYSQNPREAEAASREVAALGERALPAIEAAFEDPQTEADRLKGALKACGILGKTAAALIPEAAELLLEPALTTEAAIALSFMGPDALPPLRDALRSDDPVIRRESLRSIGKLKERAPLDTALVVPLLVGRMTDGDQGVRTVAATYLGIIHDPAHDAVAALTAGLADPDPEVRRASAAALGSFEPSQAAPALSALRKASGDQNEDVAREAGRAVVKLRQK